MKKLPNGISNYEELIDDGYKFSIDAKQRMYNQICVYISYQTT